MVSQVYCYLDKLGNQLAIDQSNHPITRLSNYQMRYWMTGRSLAFSCARFGGSVHSSRERLVELDCGRTHAFMPPSMMSHGSTASLAAVAEDVEVGVDAGFGHGGAPVLAVALGGSIAGATRRSPSDSSAW